MFPYQIKVDKRELNIDVCYKELDMIFLFTIVLCFFSVSLLVSGLTMGWIYSNDFFQSPKLTELIIFHQI